jgi:hypothetical protein
MFQVEIFWIVTPCSAVVRYQRFRGPRGLHLQGVNCSLPIEIPDASLEAFIAMMFQVEVFWFVTPCSVVVGYQSFRGPRCPHFHNTVDIRLE